MSHLLSRNDFRNAVFERDGDMCVVCKKQAQDAHHILERRLFSDGGYYLENGASVCEEHHLAAESTVLSCDELREKCGIEEIILPAHLYPDQPYDKWGNPILPNGLRMKGELFDDPSVQKILAPVLHLFTNKVRYPRTFHLPWTQESTQDDRIMKDLSGFEEEDVTVTIKMDGEQTTMYRDYIHARSLEYHPHPSRSWVKGLHARIAHDIPEGWRVCGENLYACHSIHYKHLQDLFLVFTVWNEKNECLSWAETVEWATLLGLKTVPFWKKVHWNREEMEKLRIYEWQGDPAEGYVVRVDRKFHYREHPRVCGKFVRKGHVQTHGHWMRESIVRNEKETGHAADSVE